MKRWFLGLSHTLQTVIVLGLVCLVAAAMAGAATHPAESASSSSTSSLASPTISSPEASSETASESENPSPSASATSDADPTDTDSVPSTSTTATTASVTGVTAGETAAAVLASLPIKGRAPKTGYSRSQFGEAWEDVDHNGCDTRNDILKRDLTNITYKDSCKIASGTLVSAYSGKTVDFVRGEGTSSEVQIDHIVALSDAWQKGAQQLTAAQRESLANDPLNLQAVEGSLNEQKGDGDAATWLPPLTSYRCDYVARIVSVKATYDLWVTQAEHDTIAGILDTCPGQQAYVSSFAATASSSSAPAASTDTTQQTPAAEPATPSSDAASTTGGGDADVYYKNCDAVRAAGKAPLLAGQPGYRSGLDRDKDGIACE